MAKRGEPMQKTEYQIPSPVNCTIALVTDLHEFDPASVLEILRETKPDVIAVAGDMLERHHRGEKLDKGDRSLTSRLVCAGIRAAEMLGDLLHLEQQEVQIENAHHFFREAGKIAPVVLSRGNHELYLTAEDRTVMAEAGVTLLDNESTEIGGTLFGGLTSKQVTGALDTEFLEAFSTSLKYKVLLCHHPEYYPELSRYPIDLILSGHCHGGQIRVFGRGIFAPGQGLLPKYHHGVYDGRLVVSAGCANTAPIPRWGNEPEVVIVRLGERAIAAESGRRMDSPDEKRQLNEGEIECQIER